MASRPRARYAGVREVAMISKGLRHVCKCAYKILAFVRLHKRGYVSTLMTVLYCCDDSHHPCYFSHWHKLERFLQVTTWVMMRIGDTEKGGRQGPLSAFDVPKCVLPASCTARRFWSGCLCKFARGLSLSVFPGYSLQVRAAEIWYLLYKIS